MPQSCLCSVLGVLEGSGSGRDEEEALAVPCYEVGVVVMVVV